MNGIDKKKPENYNELRRSLHESGCVERLPIITDVII
ncbi:hypothetical protein T11_2248 [Trichinella zimbabwensis]|uniref:Uncharacterized protein n=1 Tax=Trichinella zimbabwensis TaxID=268475 RepID=A0A0V1GIP7_9BILA|nr:hypothetical protein T11_2248 [Trichinella zimbabwensis]